MIGPFGDISSVLAQYRAALDGENNVAAHELTLPMQSRAATQALVRVNATNDLRAGDDEIVATWEDEVYLSIDPKAIMIFEDEA